MSDKPAFPSKGGMFFFAPQEQEKEIRENIERMDRDHAGLTRRELFAAMIMQGMYSNPANLGVSEGAIAKLAVEHSDALIKALEVGGE